MHTPHLYYYKQMDKLHRAVYDRLTEGFAKLSDVIRIPRLPMKDLSELFFQLRLDQPLIFYVETFSCRAYPDSDYMELHPAYLFDKAKIRTHQKAIEARVTRLVRPALSMNSSERERYIHDFICTSVTYDKLEKAYSHEVIGPLTNGVGVCEGISKTVKLLCDELGLECMIAICDADPEHGAKYRHAWNILKVDGKHYHMDATFDLSLGRYGTPRYDYFNLDDKRMFRDHRPVMYPAPACTDGDRFYYKVNKVSWTKPEDVSNRLSQAIRKKKDHLLFHWRGGCLTREVLVDLMERCQAAAQPKGKYLSLSVNWPQAVILLRILDNPPADSISQENPDEAE